MNSKHKPSFILHQRISLNYVLNGVCHLPKQLLIAIICLCYEFPRFALRISESIEIVQFKKLFKLIV